MMTLSILAILFVTSLSPIKLAFMVTVLSLTASVSLYLSTGVSFPSAALVISFSSGMMILFCYCATLSNHESKSNLKVSMMVMAACIPIFMSTKESMVEMSSMTESLMFGQSKFLLIAIMVVMLAMVCINKSMFHPQKSLMTSY